MPKNFEPDSPLSMTARWTAAVRAQESARKDRLFDDPWATALAGEVGAAWIETRSAGSGLPIAIRTRFFDDFLQRVSLQHRVRQTVLIAAGLDTRAFRLQWPEQARLFELDRASVLDYKERILHSDGARPLCDRRLIGVDLTTPWRETLVASGFDRQECSCWLLEGLLFYMTNEQTADLLDQVTSLAVTGSWLGFDVVNGATLTSPLTRTWIEMQASLGAPWIGTMDDPEEFLSARGWQATLTQAGAPDANYGRWSLPVIPVKMPDMPHNWFVVAQKE